MASSWVPRSLASYSRSLIAISACQISEQCRKLVKADIDMVPWPLRSKQCNVNDLVNLYCICSQDSPLKDNKFFDSHCLFAECTGTEARKGFMNAFLAACARNKQQATNIPAEWAPYLPTGLPKSTQQTSTVGGSTRSAMTSSRLRSTDSVTISADSTVSSFAMTTMAWSAAEVSEPAQPSSTNWADSQRPICAITNKCLFDRNKNDPCKLENLRCVCKYSSSIGKSSYFRSSCLFDTCYSELGRQEWMNAFAYACNMVNKTLFDITPQWERYIPQWYLDSLPSTTTAAAYPTSATIVTNNPHTDISEGGIAGISVAAITAAVLLAICGLIFWRKDQKLKRKSREVAQMADAMQPRGVQQRIDQLTYGSSSDEDVRPEPLQNNDKHEIYAHVGKSRDGNGEGGQHGCLQSLPLFNLRTSSTPYPHGTAELLQSPQITHQPYPYERSIGRRVSHRSAMAGRTSTDNMGTTAVTSSPVERYPVEHDVGNDTARSRAPVYDEHGGKVTWG